MTNVFAVVGQHRAAPDRLLLLGEDGRYYAYASDGAPARVDLSAAWALDVDGRSPRAASPAPAVDRPLKSRAGRRHAFAGGTLFRTARSLVLGLGLLLGLVLAAPAALAHGPGLAVATAEGALRSAPADAAPVLVTVPIGSEVELTGAAAQEFLEVLANGQQGWMTAESLDDGRLETATAPAGAVVRDAPDPEGGAVVTVPAGATVILTGATVDGYAAASFSGVGGWIASAEVTPIS